MYCNTYVSVVLIKIEIFTKFLFMMNAATLGNISLERNVPPCLRLQSTPTLHTARLPNCAQPRYRCTSYIYM
jgi:hypothetical protein